MRLAIVAAGFTPEEADQLRRAMATFKLTGGVAQYRDRLVDGMVRRGYERDFAERVFQQIEGFGSYGFPESHAACFAQLVYASAWVKCHHPAVFACALLNSQPMGFYAPAQIVRDAKEHGVAILAVDVNASDWDSRLEARPASTGGLALRLGLRLVAGLPEAEARAHPRRPAGPQRRALRLGRGGRLAGRGRAGGRSRRWPGRMPSPAPAPAAAGRAGTPRRGQRAADPAAVRRGDGGGPGRAGAADAGARGGPAAAERGRDGASRTTGPPA